MCGLCHSVHNAIGTTAGDLLEVARPFPPLRRDSDQLRMLEKYQAGFRDRVNGLEQRLRRGELTLAEWETAFRDELRDLHVNATVIARGGDRGAVTQSEWGRVGGTIRAQYRWLHGFALDIQRRGYDNLTGAGEFPSEAYMRWRSGLYAGSGRAAYYRGRVRGLLSIVPGDGQTACGSSCRCILEFEEGDQPWIVHVRWVVDHDAESCPDCLRLAAEWDPYVLELPVGLSAGEATYWLSLGPEAFPLDRRAALALGS